MFAKTSAQAILMSQETGAPVNWRWLRRVFALLLLTSVVAWSIHKAYEPGSLPIRRIHATGTFTKVNEQMLRDAVAGSIDGGYFRIDMNRTQQVVAAIPWVDTASVRRVWPDTLAIDVQEQKAIGYWMKGGLVNVRGDIFTPQQTTYPQGLPLFSGPDESQQQLLEYYTQANTLLAKLDLSVSEIHMDARRALSLKLSNGMEVILGRESIVERLQRLARIYTKVITGHVDAITRIDMRYSNGLAVAWHKAPSH
jgi:cell division protein FtsQ